MTKQRSACERGGEADWASWGRNRIITIVAEAVMVGGPDRACGSARAYGQGGKDRLAQSEVGGLG